MPLLEWNAGLSVEVAEMDAEHRQLFTLINELNDAMKAGRGKEELDRVLDELTGYTRTHFASEERWMEQAGYPHLDRQKAEHAELLDRVVAFRQDYDAGKAMVSVKLMGFLRDWVRNHIQKSDKDYGVWAKRKADAGGPS